MEYKVGLCLGVSVSDVEGNTTLETHFVVLETHTGLPCFPVAR
jgi:hypothetical protein